MEVTGITFQGRRRPRNLFLRCRLPEDRLHLGFNGHGVCSAFRLARGSLEAPGMRGPAAARRAINTHFGNLGQDHRHRDGRTNHDFYRDVQVGPCGEYESLLIVFLTEEGDVGRTHIEELEHHRGHAGKMARPDHSFEPRRDVPDLDASGMPRRIHFFVSGREHKVGTVFGQQLEIGVERAAGTWRSLRGARTRRVHKDVTTVTPHWRAARIDQACMFHVRARLVGTRPMLVPAQGVLEQLVDARCADSITLGCGEGLVTIRALFRHPER